MAFISRTSGEPCRAIDYTVLYWLIPAIALLIIGLGIGAARHALTRASR